MNTPKSKALQIGSPEWSSQKRWRLDYDSYSKLPTKHKEIYNEREKNAKFDAKMKRKGFGSSSGSRKLSKFFGN